MTGRGIAGDGVVDGDSKILTRRKGYCFHKVHQGNSDHRNSSQGTGVDSRQP